MSKAHTVPHGHHRCVVCFSTCNSWVEATDIRVADYPYSSTENPQRRSMSGPSGSRVVPSSALSGLSTQEREVARQRRRVLQESRRESKVRVRRTRLPSTLDSRSSEVREVGYSIDSFTASSNASSAYDIGNTPYARTGSVSSSQGPYMGGISS